MTRADHKIGSVETTFDVLEALMRNEEAGVTELGNLLDLPKSTVFSHLTTLRDRGYVNVDDGKYRLSLRFLEFGERTRQSQGVYQIAKPELDQLAVKTGELVNLMIEEEGEGVYLYLTRGDEAIQLDTYPGMRVPLYCTALGKVALAYMDHERREDYIRSADLKSVTPNTVTDPKHLREQLEEIRERGFALDRGERAQDLRCVAAPIVVDDTFRAAISVTGPLPRMRGERFTDEIPNKVMDTASVIQINMTYS